MLWWVWLQLFIPAPQQLWNRRFWRNVIMSLRSFLSTKCSSHENLMTSVKYLCAQTGIWPMCQGSQYTWLQEKTIMKVCPYSHRHLTEPNQIDISFHFLSPKCCYLFRIGNYKNTKLIQFQIIISLSRGISRHKHREGYLCLMLLLLAYTSILPTACKCWVTCHTNYVQLLRYTKLGNLCMIQILHF